MTPDERELRNVLLDHTHPPSGITARTFGNFRERLEGTQTRPHWLVGAIAVALAILVVGTFTLITAALHPGGSTSPAASAARIRSTSPPAPSAVVAEKCQSADLAVRLMGIAQAMNQPRAEFELTSAAAAACRMNGWPAVQMLDAGGASLPTKLIQTTSVYVPGTEEKPQDVVMQPGGHAYFGVGWVNSVAPGACERPAAFRITLPGTSGPVDVGVVLGNGSLPEVCADGALDVIPIQAVPPAINFNITTSPTPSPAGELTGDQAGSFCLVNGSASLRVDFSGGSPPSMHVVARGLPANSEIEILWGNPAGGGAYYVGRFMTDANGNANANPAAAPLQPTLTRAVYVDYYPPGTNSSNTKPRPYGLAQSC